MFNQRIYKLTHPCNKPSNRPKLTYFDSFRINISLMNQLQEEAIWQNNDTVSLNTNSRCKATFLWHFLNRVHLFTGFEWYFLVYKCHNAVATRAGFSISYSAIDRIYVQKTFALSRLCHFKVWNMNGIFINENLLFGCNPSKSQWPFSAARNTQRNK